MKTRSKSAINSTSVTVIVEPVKEASEEATIEVKNSKGEVVAVEPIVVEVGETELVFDFAEEQKEEALVGVWKVNGVEYNFDAIKQLGDIKKEATAPVNEIKFLAALNAAGIKNVDENKLSEYATKLVEKDEEIETLEDVQAIIDEVNKGEATKEEQDAAVKAVKEAKNQIQLLAALEAGFERVNADWIVEYATDSTNGLLGKDNLTFEGIQNAVDAINKEKVEEKITAAEAKLDSKLVSEAKTLVENYIKEDGKNETAKKEMLDKLAVHQAVINVNLANTNNKLDAAFKALAELVEDNVFDIETVKPELLKAYRDAIAEEAKKETPANKTAANIQTIVSGVNQAAGEAEDAINGRIQSDSINITVANKEQYKDKGRLLGYYVTFSLDENYKIKDTDSIVIELLDEKDNVLGKQSLNAYGYKNHGEKGAIGGTIDVYGEYKATSWDNTWNGKMTDIPAKVVVRVKFKADGAVAEVKKDVDEGIKTSAKNAIEGVLADDLVKVIKESKDAAEIEETLIALANLGKAENFLNTPKADRTFVAETILEEKAETKKAWTVDGLNNYVGTVNTTITGALTAVNALTNASEEADVITALENVKVFDDLAAIAKKDVANAFIEEVLEGLEEDKTPNFKSYTELSNFVEGLIK